ncbi:SDR family oxidoreductase [Limibacter armeniacum]|uniref:SDR family oxidoreductase n=1 Tax=Limibacter armeniacum TaxID=466084 RepID=UPI002FE69D0E
MQKVLITGANGLLGQNLTRLLVEDGKYEVIATGRGTDRLCEDGYTYYELDITDNEAVSHLIGEIKPDFVVHTAAMTQVDDCEREPEKANLINIAGTFHIIDACRLVDAFLLYISTDFVFNGETGLLTEEENVSPVNYYGQTKLAAEKLVQESKLKWAIARTVLVYGQVKDMSRSNIILWVKKNLEAGKPIKVVDDQWRTPTLALDLAKGCELILDKKAEGIFHISGKDYLRPYDIAIRTAEYFGLDKSLISPTNASQFVEVGKRPLKTGFNIRKAQTQLGYEPHSFEEGIRIMQEGF